MKRFSIFAFLAISCFSNLLAQVWDYDSTNNEITTMSQVGIGVPSWTDMGPWSFRVDGNSLYNGAIKFFGLQWSGGKAQGLTIDGSSTFQYNTENAGGYSFTDSHTLFSDGFGFYHGYNGVGSESVTKSYVSAYWGIDFFTGDDKSNRAPALSISKNRKVGINTLNPDKPLTIVGGSWEWNLQISDDDEENTMYIGWHEGRQQMEIQTIGNNNWAEAPLMFGMHETYFENRVGIGTKNLKPDYDLTVKGRIVCEELKVELSGSDWGDFVFEEDYNLTSLEETEDFISKNKHLPGIPSADSITANGGIAIGEMQKMQMVKIEELTLHVIEMNKENHQLETKNEALLKANDQLSERLNSTEKRLLELEQKMNGLVEASK